VCVGAVGVRMCVDNQQTFFNKNLDMKLCYNHNNYLHNIGGRRHLGTPPRKKPGLGIRV
jgi:hypothetical protein